MRESGGWQGEAVAQTFMRCTTMMMPTYGDDGSHPSKVYQQHQQVAPPTRSARRESHEGMPCSRTAHGMTTGVKMQHSRRSGPPWNGGRESPRPPGAAWGEPSGRTRSGRNFSHTL